jgi:hypothetical protein
VLNPAASTPHHQECVVLVGHLAHQLGCSGHHGLQVRGHLSAVNLRRHILDCDVVRDTFDLEL